MMGVIRVPHYCLGEKGCAWVDEADWTFKCHIKVTLDGINARGRGRQFLCFECLDTFATVYVNGQFVGTAENGFIPQIDSYTHLTLSKDFRVCH